MEPLVIIGNGPAGIACAREVSSLDPLIVSPQEKPSPSVCGGVLTRKGIDYLSGHGLLDPLREAGAVPLEKITVVHNGKSIAARNLTDGPFFSLNRAHLDRFLWEALEPTPRHRTDYVRDLRINPDHVELETRSGETLRAEGIVDASGHRRISRSPDPPDQTLIGREWHAGESKDDHELVLIAGRGFYGGIAPDGRGQLTISAVQIGQDQEINQLWRVVYEELPPHWKQRLPEHPPSEEQSKAGFWNETGDRPFRERIAVAGDALGFTMPLSGEGITMALREGETVGRHLKQKSMGDSPIFPFDTTDRTRLRSKTVRPFKRQRTRRDLTHWLGSHGNWVARLNRLLPGIGNLLLKYLIP